MSKMATPDQAIDTNCMTLNRFILREQRKYPEATGDLTHLLNSIMVAVKAIEAAVRKGEITDLLGVANENTSSTKIELLANEILVNMIKSSYTVCAMVTRESTELIEVETERNARYVVYFDPLDGQNNIDCLISIGTIFGIARKPDDWVGPITEGYCLQPGKNYVASGYALYGSATMLVLTTGNGVDGFTLDPSIGEFVLSDPNMKIKERGKIYSIDEGYEDQFEKPLKDYLKSVKNPQNGRGVYGARYVGSLIADFHRTLKYGGIFMYPANKAYPYGKIRLLYACNPIAHIIEQAGGLASNGKERILNIVPKGLHDRQPIFIGSKKDVEDFLQFQTDSDIER